MVKKKTSKKKTEKKPKKVKLDRQDKQTIGVVVGIVLLFVIFLGGYYYFQSLKHFEHLGVDWDIQEYPNLKLYHTRFPIKYRGEVIANYNMYLRNDPRENNIPVNVSQIGFERNVILSLDDSSDECSGVTRAGADLAMFVSAFPFVTNVTGALTNQTKAEELGLQYADCGSDNSNENKTIIIFQKGESARVVEDNGCYIINFGDCEVSKSIERFQLEILDQLNFKKA